MNPLLSQYIPFAVLDAVNDLNTARLIAEKSKTPAGPAAEALAKGLDERVAKIAPNAPKPFADNRLVMEENVPKNFEEALTQGIKFAGNERLVNNAGESKGHRIYMNPEGDRTFLAHELGHTATDSTKIGNTIRSLRANPKLAISLMLASGLVPGTVTALTPGDEDVATGVGLALATAAPTIFDETLASKNALAIMDAADMRATLGQRGKLAGGLLTYIGKPLSVGLGASLTGNIFDQPSDSELTPM